MFFFSTLSDKLKHVSEIDIYLEQAKKQTNKISTQANQSHYQMFFSFPLSLSISISVFFPFCFFFLACFSPHFSCLSPFHEINWLNEKYQTKKKTKNLCIRNGHYTGVYDEQVDHHRLVLLMNLVIVSHHQPWNRYGRNDFPTTENHWSI